jgi:hypothetical protein
MMMAEVQLLKLEAGQITSWKKLPASQTPDEVRNGYIP